MKREDFTSSRAFDRDKATSDKHNHRGRPVPPSLRGIRRIHRALPEIQKARVQSGTEAFCTGLITVTRHGRVIQLIR